MLSANSSFLRVYCFPVSTVWLSLCFLLWRQRVQSLRLQSRRPLIRRRRARRPVLVGHQGRTDARIRDRSGAVAARAGTRAAETEIQGMCRGRWVGLCVWLCGCAVLFMTLPCRPASEQFFVSIYLHDTNAPFRFVFRFLSSTCPSLLFRMSLSFYFPHHSLSILCPLKNSVVRKQPASDSKEWRTHLESTTKHSDVIKTVFPETRTALQKLGAGMVFCCFWIRISELL
jgi:hypothetical protein